MSEKIRVVIVDDIAETREHLTKLLSFESDIEVVGAAASGEEAVDLTGKLQPDILLMDINMPGMDGIATTERVSATFPATSIIMMSVQGEADYLRRSMLAGAREFLVKPFSSDELTASIRQVYIREKAKRGRMIMAAPGTPGPDSHTQEGQDRHPLRAQGRGRPDHAGRQPGGGHGRRAASDRDAGGWVSSSSATWVCC